jgi:CelD/BcsL family acetyltransferase involved in cellulose biosynthesis
MSSIPLLATATARHSSSVAITRPAERAKQPLDVWHVSNVRQFSSLASHWDRLYRGAAATSVFNSWMWNYAWWDLWGAGRSLKVLVAGHGGVAQGILPMYEDRARAFGLGVRVLRLLGTDGDRNPYNIGPLLERGAEYASARAIADALFSTRGYDVLHFADTDPGAAFAAALRDAAAAAHVRCEVRRSKRLAALHFPSSWNAYLRSLSSSQRASIRHRRHALLGTYATRFFVRPEGASLETVVDTLAALQRKRAGGSSEQQHLPLQRSAISQALAQGSLRLYCLELGGSLAAAICGIRFRDRIVLMQSECDPEYARWHATSVLLQYAIEQAIDEGAAGFDFMCGGQDCGGEVIAEGSDAVQLTAFRSTIAAAAFRAQAALSPGNRS